MLEAGLGQVSQQSKGTLADLGHGVLHALVEEGEDVGVNHQSLNVAAQPLSHAWMGGERESGSGREKKLT